MRGPRFCFPELVAEFVRISSVDEKGGGESVPASRERWAVYSFLKVFPGWNDDWNGKDHQARPPDQGNGHDRNVVIPSVIKEARHSCRATVDEGAMVKVVPPW